MTSPAIIRALAALLCVMATACAGSVGSPVAAEPAARTSRTTIVETDLLRLDLPRGWAAHEHDDRAGVTVTGRRATLDVTLVPAVLFGAVGVEVPADVTAEQLADIVVPMFAARDGVTAGAPRIVDLDDDREAVSVPTRAQRTEADGRSSRNAQVERRRPRGEVTVFPVAPGVLVVGALRTTGRAADVRVARSILGAATFTGTADELLAVLDPPMDG